MRLRTIVLFLFITCATLTAGTLHAQKVSLKEVKLDLSIQDYRLEDVIDGTPDADHIGYGYKGLVNSSLKKVYFDDSVTEEFEEIFKPVFSKSKDAIPLVIRINNIQVNEWSEFLSTKVNLVSLSLSIFQQTEEDKYILIADRVINDFNTQDLGKKNINQLIGKAINRAFDYLDLYVEPNKPGLTWTELWEYQPFLGLSFPKLKDELQLFEHYSDFRQYKAFEGSTATFVKKGSKTVMLDDSGKHPSDIWGYSYEGKLYINTGKKFIPLKQVDEDFFTILNSADRRDVIDGINMFFGVNKIISILALVTAQDNFKLLLSNETGFLDIKSKYDLVEVKDRSALGEKTIIEFAPFGHPDDILDIKIDGEVMIQLSKGDFFQISNRLEAKELQACANGKCTTITIDEAPLHRIILKKDKISQEPFTDKEKARYLRNVDLKYWVLF